MSTPFTTALLASEINTDPEGLGYAALKAAGNQAGIIALLNAPQAGSTYQQLVSTALPATLLGCFTAADFLSMTSLQAQKLALYTDLPSINLTNANTVAQLTALVEGIAGISTTTLNNLNAAFERQGSRAEYLWGSGTVVTLSQVSVALGGNP